MKFKFEVKLYHKRYGKYGGRVSENVKTSLNQIKFALNHEIKKQ